MSSAFMWYSPSELTCFICKDYFTDPVTITCGHSFCAPCLCLLWEDTRTPTCCPVCRAVSLPMNFKSIILAKKQVLPAGESFPFQSPSSAMQVCKTHQIVKIFFCPFDKILLCLLCCYSPGHATHRHHPGKQAAEHYRENILKQMKSIWKNKQENQRNLNKVTDIFREWEGVINLRMAMIRAEYPKVHRYLREELQNHLESLANEGNMIFQQLRRNRSSMIHIGKSLRRIYGELKELCCKADMDLLQEVGLFLCRSQLVQLYMPKPVDPQLTAWTITGMSERLNNFRVYITLEHRISKCEAPLFEELRHLQCSSHHQDLPLNPASLEYTPSWGAQTFTSGKHYWEMDMGHSCNWIIGLCKESWAHRKDMRLNSEGIFLLLCVKVDDHFNLFSTSPLIRQYIQRPQGWVGVFLDCECGIVSFVNVAKSSLICNFLSCSFSFPLRPFICYGPK
ncbi:tripartite motif-containing protein 77 isoform X1 [Pteronotus mesoamericanus]|uniref:tripartite motif-containing protein 77 isoform X1 n=1 Tax=Pteronotus mesoamericanus TaxID=1884717 RepID=UPI0023EB2B24|nr:tripartite motif-containing protein 77 isoform X1 [Pteronotus parnellii mesoamericanus]